MNRLVQNCIILAGVFAVFGLVSGTTARADEEDGDATFQYRTISTKEGLHFRVPEDMPIEIRGGIQTPIPFDEYVYGKFQRMERKIQRLDARLSAAEKELAGLKEKKPPVLKN